MKIIGRIITRLESSIYSREQRAQINVMKRVITKLGSRLRKVSKEHLLEAAGRSLTTQNRVFFTPSITDDEAKSVVSLLNADPDFNKFWLVYLEYQSDYNPKYDQRKFWLSIGGAKRKSNKGPAFNLKSIPNAVGTSKYSNAELIEIAQEVGQKMFGKSNQGLVLSKKPRVIKTNNFKRLQEDVANIGDDTAQGYVGTYEFIIFPSKRRGLDGSDTLSCVKDAKRMMDVDGNIYLCDGEADVISVMKPVVKPQDMKAVIQALLDNQ